MNQPNAPATTTAASIPHHTGFGSRASATPGTSGALNPSDTSELAYAPMPKNATCPSESCPV